MAFQKLLIDGIQLSNIHHYHHLGVPTAQIPLILFCYPSLSAHPLDSIQSTNLMNVSLCWSANTCVPMCRCP